MSADLRASQWAAQACCIPESQDIHIRPDATPQQQGAALVHELIHACFAAFEMLPEELQGLAFPGKSGRVIVRSR